MIVFSAERGTGQAQRPAAIVVGTQAANIPSVRLYESLGFRLRSSQYVLHHHGKGQACR
jgi:ribosomal protein S18 acetylase RimI-like enzyme